MNELKTKFLGCPLCSGQSVSVVQADCRNYVSWHDRLPPVLSWMRCSSCGHVHTEDYWTKAGLEQVFAHTHTGQAAGDGNPEQKRQTWKPVVQNVLTVLGGYSMLQRLDPAPMWLDVGCGDGGLVMTAAEFGFNAIGLDARIQTVQALLDSGYQAVCSDFMTVQVKGNPFIISMMDVLEHLPNPCEALQQAHALLHPNGVLVISLPNSDCSSWRLMGNANPYWIEIEHYHNFSRQRLLALLNQYGFDAVHYDIPFRYKAQMELYAVKKTSMNRLSQKQDAETLTNVAQQTTKPPAVSNPIAQLLATAVDCHQAGELQQAELLYQQILQTEPNHSGALNLLGVIASQMDKDEKAIELISKAIKLNPNISDYYGNLGISLRKQNKLNEAIACYQKALSIAPNCFKTHSNLGNLFKQQGKRNEAIACYRQALLIKPDYADGHNNLATVLQEKGELDGAIESCHRAIAIKPNYADAYFNLGVALECQGKLNEAIESYHKALVIKPDYTEAHDGLLHSQLHCCEWTEYSEHIEKVISAMSQDEKIYRPFVFLNVCDSPQLQWQCARRFALHRYPLHETLEWTGQRYKHNKIRIAYLSADFHNHATAYLMIELFEKHDRNRFEIIAISFGIDDKSNMRKRVQDAFNQFIDVRDKSHHEIASLLKELEIDIAVDLKGYTGDSRAGILAHRPAPIQVNYLGYPGTMGANYIDYIIADKHLIPENQQIYYTERVVYLPDSYQVTDSNRVIDDYIPTRFEVNLPETGFIFCCFNNNYKITPMVFDIWMRLLGAVDGSVLWLLEANSYALDNLRKEAIKRGIDPQRLVFAPRMEQSKHLARQKLADLFLDTLPYNAHTTTSDALWAGLPVLTCMGESFASRVAGSLLYAIDLPELVTHNLVAYEVLALKLATTPSLLAEIRSKLERNRHSKPLFDTERFRCHIETAYITMWERHQRGEIPISFW